MRAKGDAVITQDHFFVCILGWDKMKDVEALCVYHTKKGVLLHKIPIKYVSMQRMSKFNFILISPSQEHGTAKAYAFGTLEGVESGNH